MKKFLSILLALVMAFSAAITAFAAESEITVGQAEKITLQKNESANYSFTAPKDGYYDIYSLIPEEMCGAWMSVYLNGKIIVKTGVYRTERYDSDGSFCGSEGCAGNAEMFMKAGTKIEIKLKENLAGIIDYYLYESKDKYDAKCDNPFESELTVSCVDVKELKLGENKELVGDYYMFTPESSGFYTFSSKTAEKCESTAYFYEENNVACLADSYDFGGNDKDFNVTLYLEEGKSYALNINAFDTEAEEEVHYTSEDLASPEYPNIASEETEEEAVKFDCTVSKVTKKHKIFFEKVKATARRIIKKIEIFIEKNSEKRERFICEVKNKFNAFKKDFIKKYYNFKKKFLMIQPKI